MALKSLLLVSFMLVMGFGEGNSRIDEISYLKTEAESSLSFAKYFKHIFSDTALNYIYLLKEKESLENINEIFSQDDCENNILSDMFSNFIAETKRISQPLNFWISEMSNHIEKVNLYLDRSRKTKEVVQTLSYLVDPKQRPLPALFEGECHIPGTNEKPGPALDSNDIYSYQEKIEGCKINDFERFQCGSGECINFNSTCDGVFDCWDGSDELGLCHDESRCNECAGVCLLGPKGPHCLATCPKGFKYSFKVCPNQQTCHNICYRGMNAGQVTTKCLVKILPNVVDIISESLETLRNLTYSNYINAVKEIHSCKNKKNNGKLNFMPTTLISSPEAENTAILTKSPVSIETVVTWHNTRSNLTWHTTTRHPTWHTTTRHPTWHPTTRHPTWHTTTRHPTWHPTTRHPTWHPTTRHPTWHTTTRHPTWHPTTRHPTWHTTTRHPTWHPTTRHPTWHPTTRHPTWHTTTRHPTWHTTTRHPTWHPTTRHPTWHTTTRHPTWHPTTRHPTWHTTTRHPTWHPTTRHPTWHPTTRHSTWHTTTEPTTWDQNETTSPTIWRTTKHRTTKHTTRHTTKHTTRHTTHHTTPHTTKHTTSHTTPTTSKTTTDHTTPHTTPTTSKTTTDHTTPHTIPTTSKTSTDHTTTDTTTTEKTTPHTTLTTTTAKSTP